MKKDFQSSQILAFDWKGNKKTKYILPYDIQSFYVSKDYIVGVAVCNGVNKIYRFKNIVKRKRLKLYLLDWIYRQLNSRLLTFTNFF